MVKYTFKFYYEKKPDETVTWKDTDNIFEPFKEYSKKIKENKDELIFFYKGLSFKYKDCEKKTFKDEVFSEINPDNTINIIVFPFRKTLRNKIPEETAKKLEPENKIQEISSPLSSSSPIKKQTNDSLSKTIPNINEIEKENEVKNEEKQFYNDILCPYCLSTAIIENTEDTEKKFLKLNIINCNNFHRIKNITYDQFESLESFPNAKCEICSAYKYQVNTPPKSNYVLCECGSYYCGNDCLSHSTHKQVEIENKNYKCVIHDTKFNSYCMDCNINLCESCYGNHYEGHEILNFQHLKPTSDYIETITKEVEEHKKVLTEFIQNSKKLFEDIINDIESYINKYIIIERTFLQRYNKGKGNLNFQLLQNIRNKKLFENYIFNDLKNFNSNQNLKNLNDIYKEIYNGKKDIKIKEDKIIKDDKINEITIKYKLKDKGVNKNIKLLDPLFIDYNKTILDLYIDDNKQPELKECFYAGSKGEITVKLKEKEIEIEKGKEKVKKHITNMAYMFNNCQDIVSIDFSKFDTTNITSMESLFQLCPFKEIKGIENWNTTNVTSMKAMFSKCINLETFPDMKNWDTSNLKDISLLFNGCISLKSIINFPKWKTPNLIDMSYMFSRCSKIEEIHNLKFNTSNVTNMCGIFNKCEQLTKISDISGWKTANVTDISILFQFCSSLKKVPDISYWNSSKFKDISGVFSECEKLVSLPNIGKWNTSEVECMCGLFNECANLTKIPDISSWNTSKVKDMSGMFCSCSKIENIPDLSKWKIPKVTDMSYMFDGCSSLKNISSIQNWDVQHVKDKSNAFAGCSNINSKIIEKWKQ